MIHLAWHFIWCTLYIKKAWWQFIALTYSFSILKQFIVPWPILTVASWPAYRFLWKQIRWSDIPISLRIFQLIVTHTVKGFSIVNEAEVDVFLEFSCFSYDPADVANLISGSSSFSNPVWTSGCSQFTCCWNLVWRILSITLLACETSTIVR